MLRRELEKHLKEIREEVGQKIPQFLDEALIIQQFNNEQRDKLADEFSISDDFELNFKAIFLEFIINLQRQFMIQQQIANPPKSIGDLFQGCFFHFDNIPKINRHPPLSKILEHINQRVNDYFRLQKSTLEFLIIQQKQMDSSESCSEVIEIVQEDETEKQIKEVNLAIQQEKPQLTNSELMELAKYQEPTEEQLNCPYCICTKIRMAVRPPFLRCAVCKNYFHMSCLRIEKPRRLFTCPECILVGIDPLHELQDSIMDPTVLGSTDQMVNQFQKRFFMKATIPSDSLIEFRSLKLDGYYEDIAWPDFGDLQLNGKRVQEFRPLATNSCLKKRKDEKIALNVELNQHNNLVLREMNPPSDMKQSFRIHQGIPYYLGVFQVKVYRLNDFINKVKRDVSSWLGIEQAKQFIQLSIMQNQFDEVTMESIKISLDCVYDLTVMQTPARGNLCEHIQCFSLENLVTMMKSVSPRKWKCPICKSLILGLQIDAYQLAILTLIKQHDLKITEVSFNQLGEVDNPTLCDLLKSQSPNLPEHARNNPIRVIPIEQIAQRILKISNMIEANTCVKVEQKKVRPPPPLEDSCRKIGNTSQEAILID